MSQAPEKQRRGFPINVGTVLEINKDTYIEEIASTPSHAGPTLTHCARLKQFGGQNRYEVRNRPAGGKVLMLPHGFRPGVLPVKVKVTWIADNGRSMAAEHFAT